MQPILPIGTPFKVACHIVVLIPIFMVNLIFFSRCIFYESRSHKAMNISMVSCFILSQINEQIPITTPIVGGGQYALRNKLRSSLCCVLVT